MVIEDEKSKSKLLLVYCEKFSKLAWELYKYFANDFKQKKAGYSRRFTLKLFPP